jgi:hypothetical protein
VRYENVEFGQIEKEKMDSEEENKIQREASALVYITPVILFLSYLLLISPQIRSLLGFSDKGQVGEYLGGVATPIIGFVSAVLVYLTFQQQIRANKIQIAALQNEIEARKIESKINKYKNIVVNLREEIKEMTYKSHFHSEVIFTGMQAVEVMTGHFLSKGNMALDENRNALDAILSITTLVRKSLVELDKESDDIKNEIMDDLHLFYMVKIRKALNTIHEVKWNRIFDSIRENREDIEHIFRHNGFILENV